MRSARFALICLSVIGCTGGTTAPTELAPDVSAAATVSSSSTTTVADTTSTSSTPTTTAPESLVAILDDGRPATFIAVTTRYEAVEVSTETGQIVRSFGTRATAADLETEGEIAPNVVDAIWRTADGRYILISECCEPAAGRINLLPPDGTLSDTYEDSAANKWAALPSPVGANVVLVGYFTTLIGPIEQEECESPVSGACWSGETFLENDGSGIAAIGWNHDGVRVHWYDPESANLLTWDSQRDQLLRAPLTWVGDDQSLVGLAGQASGNVVSFVHSYGADRQIVDTEGVVFSPETGGVVAMFEVPTGSVLGGYEPSGTFLIYTRPDGTVEFQGLGRIGQLGQGFYFASW
jgi:hypothetical protein